MNVVQVFWELNKTFCFSPLEIALFFYLSEALQTDSEIREIDTNLMCSLSMTEGQLRYAKSNLCKANVITYHSGNGRGNSTVYLLGTAFICPEKGDKEYKMSKSDKSTTLITFQKESVSVDNQFFSEIKKGDKKGDKTPLVDNYDNLNHNQKENNLSKDRLQKKKFFDHSPCPDTSARKIKSEIKSEPAFSSEFSKSKKKTRYSKVFLTEGEILNIKTFIEKFNRELGQYYGYVVYEKTNSFSRQNILKLISMYDRHTIQMVFDMIKSSDFLLNKSTPYAWRCSFDWIVVPDNFGKIFAGMYANFNEGTSENVVTTTSKAANPQSSQKPYDEFDMRTWSKEKRDEYLTEVYACWGMTYDPEEYEREVFGDTHKQQSPQKPKDVQRESKPDFSQISNPAVLKVLSDVGVINH